MISSYTFGIYPRSEELIEATRKNTENLSSLFQKETEEYITAQINANLGFVSDPLLKWDDIFRPFSNLSEVTSTALNRIFEMNTFYRVLSFDGSTFTGGNTVQSNLDSSLPKNKTAAIPEPFTFAELHTSNEYKRKDDFVINLAKMLRAEIDSLVGDGFEIIQLLAPSIAYNKEVDFGLVSDGLKILTDGLEAKTVLHTYFGDVSAKIESLLDLPVSGLGFDITTTPASSIEKHSFSNKSLAIGIINSFNTAIEKSQECIKQIDEINANTKPKESYVSNNFDLEYVPKEFAMNKISVLGEIARGAKDV
uniref:Cobalamin-independent synthase MetE domain-containing protein (MetE) n=1 Tax=uncultured marine thaumarchaeote KM3_198_G09 TaxID=1456089 RepID=A0A075GZ04_9ARCH|nr:Cobalamin-independent synthase MetE domain-containing protein (metE) [uncultured marine thaumarchaeote KM3_198_G09]